MFMSQIHPIHKLYTQKILNEFNIFLYLLFELNRIFAYKYICDKKKLNQVIKYAIRKLNNIRNVYKQGLNHIYRIVIIRIIRYFLFYLFASCVCVKALFQYNFILYLFCRVLFSMPEFVCLLNLFYVHTKGEQKISNI